MSAILLQYIWLLIVAVDLEPTLCVTNNDHHTCDLIRTIPQNKIFSIKRYKTIILRKKLIRVFQQPYSFTNLKNLGMLLFLRAQVFLSSSYSNVLLDTCMHVSAEWYVLHEITFMRICICLCVSTPESINN